MNLRIFLPFNKIIFHLHFKCTVCLIHSDSKFHLCGSSGNSNLEFVSFLFSLPFNLPRLTETRNRPVVGNKTFNCNERRCNYSLIVNTKIIFFSLMFLCLLQLAKEIEEEKEAREEMERYSNAYGKEKRLTAAQSVLFCCVFVTAISLDSLCRMG